MAKDPELSLLGRTIAGKFAIESFVGGGAMGAVYKARQIALEKTVALKILHRELGSDALFAERFHREAKAASRLDHPNSMRVIDFGEEPDGLLYIAMEFLDGKDLFSVLEEEFPLGAARVTDIVMQTLAALAMAHEMGVIHRDIKPENIMLLKGRNDEGEPADVVKVCDFGIAKITEPQGTPEERRQAPRLTTQGLVVGTPEYMSPEQGRGETLDPRSDLYSVGIILYQLLTGKVPFEGDSAVAIVLKHISEAPRRPSEILASVHPRLEAVCLKAIQKERENRFQTAREMRAELRASLHDSKHPLRAPTQEIEIVAPPPKSILTDADETPLIQPQLRPPMGGHAATPNVVRETVRKANLLSTEELHSERAVRNKGKYVFGLLLLIGVVGIAGVVVRKGFEAPAREPSSSGLPTPSAPQGEDEQSGPMKEHLEEQPPVLAAKEPAPSQLPAAGKSFPPATRVNRAHTRGAKSKPSGAVQAPSREATMADGGAPLGSTSGLPALTPAPSPPASAGEPVPTPSSSPNEAAPGVGNSGADLGRSSEFNPDTGRAIFGIPRTNGILPARVARVVPQSAITDCYRAAMRKVNKPLAAHATLHIDFVDGRTTRWAVDGIANDGASGLAACIGSKVDGLTVGSDKGTASTDIPIEFKPEP